MPVFTRWIAAVITATGICACNSSVRLAAPEAESSGQPDDPFMEKRKYMVRAQLESFGRGIKNPRVLEAMEQVPRHEFVPDHLRSQAYRDHPLPIGHGQTISQPYIVAYMSEILDPQPTDKVLEIGTGSGYQAAILAELVAEVYTIEIVEPLGKEASKTLQRLGYENVQVQIGDGFLGWPEEAPFDAIIVTCAPERIPQPLKEQIKDGGKTIIPAGTAREQYLYLLEKQGGQIKQKAVLPVRFVPMTGISQE